MARMLDVSSRAQKLKPSMQEVDSKPFADIQEQNTAGLGDVSAEFL